MDSTGKWQNGLPSSLPLPADRRHLAAFVVDPIIDKFYQNDFRISFEDVFQRVNEQTEPLQAAGGGRGSATPAAQLTAATTTRGIDGLTTLFLPDHAIQDTNPIALPVKGSASLLLGDEPNAVAFGRNVLGPVKETFFSPLCMAWIKEWKRQRNPVEVHIPNATGKELIALLPQFSKAFYLEYDSVAKKSAAYFYNEDYCSALSADQSAKAMSSWKRAMASKVKPQNAS